MPSVFAHPRRRHLRQLERTLQSLPLMFLLAGAVCGAQQVAVAPKLSSSNTIRSWGDDAMKSTLHSLQKAFHATHPDVVFTDTLYGSGTGMAGIITGTSNLALMGRPATANEIMGFQWVYRYQPLGVQVMTGSLSANGRSPALAILVHRSNPIRQLTLAQLKRILSCPGHTNFNAIQTWGQLGLTGAFAAQPIHAYLYDTETGTGAFLQSVVLGHSDKLDWSRVREYRDRLRRDGTVESAANQIADALNSDPYGIAVSTLSNMTPDMRALPLAEIGSGPYYAPTRETLIERQYPLARAIYIYVNRQPGKSLNPAVKEFLKFVLSPQGQQIIARQGDFLPLQESLAAAQAALLQ